MLSDLDLSRHHPLFRSSTSHPAGPHDRLAPKNGKSGPHCWGRVVLTQFALQFVSAVTAPLLVGCVVWSLHPVIVTVYIQLLASSLYLSLSPRLPSLFLPPSRPVHTTFLYIFRLHLSLSLIPSTFLNPFYSDHLIPPLSFSVK